MDTIGAESESRFQRWPFRFHEPWGDAPGFAMNTAPLALSSRMLFMRHRRCCPARSKEVERKNRPANEKMSSCIG